MAGSLQTFELRLPAPPLNLQVRGESELIQNIQLAVAKGSLSFQYVESNSVESLAQTFESLRTAWHRERGASSSMTRITQCQSYRRIIDDLGKQALPYILRDLEKRRHDPDHWFVALKEITKADPVPVKDRGNHPAMAKAWLKWAHSKGHAW